MNLTESCVFPVLMALGIAASLAGCPDDHGVEPADNILEVFDLTGQITVDRTYPDATVFLTMDVYARFTPADMTNDEFRRMTPAELVSVVLRDPAAGREVALPLVLRSYDLSAPVVTVGGGASKLLLDAPEVGGPTNALLAPLCDAALTEVLVTIRVPECDCTKTVVTPLALNCREDRRATEQLAITGAATPTNRPCHISEDATDPQVQEFGYDKDGRHLFTDVFFGEDWVERQLFDYDAAGKLARLTVIYPEDNEIGTITTFTRDASGNLLSRTRHALASDERSIANYAYTGPNDWVSTGEDGQVRETGTYHVGDASLTVVAGTSEVTATFGRPFSREAWLGTATMERFHTLETTSLSTGGITRTLTWSEGRVLTDTSTAGSLVVHALWQYDDCE